MFCKAALTAIVDIGLRGQLRVLEHPLDGGHLPEEVRGEARGQLQHHRQRHRLAHR